MQPPPEIILQLKTPPPKTLKTQFSKFRSHVGVDIRAAYRQRSAFSVQRTDSEQRSKIPLLRRGGRPRSVQRSKNSPPTEGWTSAQRTDGVANKETAYSEQRTAFKKFPSYGGVDVRAAYRQRAAFSVQRSKNSPPM